jgi:WXG100 family type VII secretion target
MATFTDVDTDQVRIAAQGIRQNIDAMKKTGGALNSRVLNELVTCWQGEAKDCFSQQFTSFCASLMKLLEEYEALLNDLEAADSDYRLANDRITSHISQLQ